MKATEYFRLARIENYHWWYRSIHQLLLNTLAQRVNPDRKKTIILDAGCGTGGLTEQLMQLGKVIGVDISSLALKLAKSGKAQYIHGSINGLPLVDSSADAITSVSVLYHRQVQDHKAIDEMARVVKPGGTIILVLPAFSWLYSTHDAAVHTKKRYTLAQAKRLMEKAGIHTVSARYIFSFLFPTFLLKRLLERWIKPATSISDLTTVPVWLNRLLVWVCCLEWNITKHIPMPFGSSLLIVGVKP